MCNDCQVALEEFMVRNRLADPLAVLHDEPTTPVPAHVLITEFTEQSYDGVCSSSSARITPIRVKNTDGEWRVIVQQYGEVLQRENVVICKNLAAACSRNGRREVFLELDPLTRSCFRYYCSQLKAVKRLLAFDPCNPIKGLFVDSFPIPSACSCRWTRVICWILRHFLFLRFLLSSSSVLLTVLLPIEGSPRVEIFFYILYGKLHYMMALGAAYKYERATSNYYFITIVIKMMRETREVKLIE